MLMFAVWPASSCTFGRATVAKPWSAAVSWYTRSRGSESELVQEEAHSWSLRDGRIARFEWGKDLRTALEAAGLEE